MLDEISESLVVPAPTLVEIDYWLRKRFGADTWSTFVRDIVEGAYRLYHPDEDDLERAAALQAQYESLGLDLVDASVIVTCERLEESKVATLDWRHFSVVRPRHCEALQIIPGPRASG